MVINSRAYVGDSPHLVVVVTTTEDPSLSRFAVKLNLYSKSKEFQHAFDVSESDWSASRHQ